MPIYKMKGKKDGKQKYRVRINYIDSYGKARQIERVTYGNEEAKQLERELSCFSVWKLYRKVGIVIQSF